MRAPLWYATRDVCPSIDRRYERRRVSARAALREIRDRYRIF